MGFRAMGFCGYYGNRYLRYKLIGEVPPEESPLERENTYSCLQGISHRCGLPEHKILIDLMSRLQFRAPNIDQSGAMHSHPIVKDSLDFHRADHHNRLISFCGMIIPKYATPKADQSK